MVLAMICVSLVTDVAPTFQYQEDSSIPSAMISAANESLDRELSGWITFGVLAPVFQGAIGGLLFGGVLADCDRPNAFASCAFGAVGLGATVLAIPAWIALSVSQARLVEGRKSALRGENPDIELTFDAIGNWLRGPARRELVIGSVTSALGLGSLVAFILVMSIEPIEMGFNITQAFLGLLLLLPTTTLFLLTGLLGLASGSSKMTYTNRKIDEFLPYKPTLSFHVTPSGFALRW